MRRPFSPVQRWPLLLDHASPDRGTGARLMVAGVGLLLVGLALALEGRFGLPARSVVAAIGAAPILWMLLSRRRPARVSATFVEADAGGVTRVTPNGKKSLVRWETPVGISLLASYGRPTALLAFTTATETRYVPARIDERTEADDELFARIAVLADLDLVDGVAHDASLSASSAADLIRVLERRQRGALGRAFLSDGVGTPIALDRATLSVGDRVFDLTSAVEWRALMFHESTGQAAALYQATWIRQASAEVVLVAPMPASIVPRDAQQKATGKLGRALTRDLRLLQAPAEPPPPHEVRVAIDRPFMMAVRRVLDDAPLASRIAAAPPSQPRAAGRDSIV
jgi:hypothetical protein